MEEDKQQRADQEKGSNETYKIEILAGHMGLQHKLVFAFFLVCAVVYTLFASIGASE